MLEIPRSGQAEAARPWGGVPTGLRLFSFPSPSSPASGGAHRCLFFSLPPTSPLLHAGRHRPVERCRRTSWVERESSHVRRVHAVHACQASCGSGSSILAPARHESFCQPLQPAGPIVLRAPPGDLVACSSFPSPSSLPAANLSSPLPADTLPSSSLLLPSPLLWGRSVLRPGPKGRRADPCSILTFRPILALSFRQVTPLSPVSTVKLSYLGPTGSDFAAASCFLRLCRYPYNFYCLYPFLIFCFLCRRQRHTASAYGGSRFFFPLVH